ncbi:MAG: acyltransferase family protein, partial [Lachnospiraceae bacterium]|nr:acyltransferase family protein [Lachnospiraceae bacterium]
IKEIAAGEELQVEKILSYFRPSYWFVFVYAALYLISPVINAAWDGISVQGRKITLILMIGLFSIYPTILDMTGSITQFDMSGFNTVGLSGAQAGYSIVNFVLMYMIGLYLRDRKDRDGEIVPGRMKVVLLLFLNILIILIWSILDQTVFNRHTALIPAWAYYNPFVITEAVLFFLAFNRLKLKNSRVINSLAAASFPSYLIHINLLEYCKIEQAVKANPLILTAHIILCPVVIYLTSYLIYTVYMTVFRPIFGMIGQRWKRHRKYEIKSE